MKTKLEIDGVSWPTDYLKISIYGAALALLWPSLHSLVLPLRLLGFVPEAHKNSYLGIFTVSGLMLAALVQRLAGAISDRANFGWGRRRPFIFPGTLLALVFLLGIGLPDTFLFLFLGYCLLQIASNLAQGPFQAFIPDIVPQGQRGRACGVKIVTEVAVSFFLRVVAHFMDMYSGQGDKIWLWTGIGFLGIMLMKAMVATILLVRELPLPSGSQPLGRTTLFNSYRIDVKQNQDFVWFLLSRLLILMALMTLQSFALYFLRDVVGVPNPAGVAGDLLVAVGIGLLMATYPAGRLSDRFGRKPVIFLSGLVGAVSVLLLLFVRTYPSILVCGVLLGFSAGAFMSANWALATDLVPSGEEARYLGLTNLATAGAGALARLISPMIDFLNSREFGLGYLTMVIVCVLYFILGATLILKVGKKR